MQAYSPEQNAVLDALIRNRSPGWSFTGHLLGISYDRIGDTNCMLRCASADHVLDDIGRVDFGAVAVLGDLALGVCSREATGASVRMATMSIGLTMHDAIGQGDLTARSQLSSYDPRTRISTSLARIFCGNSLLCTLNGVFKVLPAPEGLATLDPRFRSNDSVGEYQCSELTDLTDREARIYSRVAGTASASGQSFLSRFWGFEVKTSRAGASGRVEIGPHIGNRVGHVQGGILYAFAAEVARVAAGGAFRLVSMHASYHRPGEGGVLCANALRSYQGRTTSVINTAVTDGAGCTMLFAQSTYCRA
ncbi:hypothetical protein C7410_10462 [Paraburkholderia silvatlantica]|uniref:Acyl-coenzyme A thioesterase PaaI-like protein n=2 Tax=Paraburkholderia silvatlantica TaxID=321895 RepID=A0A2V4TJ21_9BURK|nr:hypothetical protein C7410_10462 [Paraburkholderia silvatlantica]